MNSYLFKFTLYNSNEGEHDFIDKMMIVHANSKEEAETKLLTHFDNNGIQDVESLTLE